MLATYYRAADVAAIPYLRVYQSGVCLTAYAFHRPVVATGVGGRKLETGLAGRGCWYRPPTLIHLAWPGTTAPDRTQAQAMGAFANAWAGEAFNWDTIAQRHAEVFRDVWLRRSGARQAETHSVSNDV